MDILCKNVHSYTTKEASWPVIDRFCNIEVRCDNAAIIKNDPYHIRHLGIKKVIFNGPATIVMFDDGTKSVVKCQDMSMYDMDKGLAFALLKRVFGNKYNDIFKRYIWEVDHPVGPTVKTQKFGKYPWKEVTSSEDFKRFVEGFFEGLSDGIEGSTGKVYEITSSAPKNDSEV